MPNKPLKACERLFHGVVHSMTDNYLNIEVHGIGGEDFAGGIDYLKLDRPTDSQLQVGDYIEVVVMIFKEVENAK